MRELGAVVRSKASVSVLVVAGAAWVGVVVVARAMGSMPGTMGLGVGAFVAVWTLMMVAMMLPSVAPFASVYGRLIGERRPARSLAFYAGYVVVWSAAALPAYALATVADRQVAPHRAGATLLAVLIFAACGAYQLTAMKDRCLALCRSPLGLAMKYSAYRGRTRDLRVGLHHGAFCLGCCWALMALLVAFGVMNLAAMAVLAAVVFAEKTQPWGVRLGRVVGVTALVLAVAVAFVPALAPGLHHDTPAATKMEMR